jgi:alkylresorcinol/alkylpyrone synthase
LSRAGIGPEKITGWVLHGGGRDVLAAMREEFALSEEEVGHSLAVLREYGNLSSPFVLFVLKRALDAGGRGGVWWLASFGAGFSSHGALLEVGHRAP